MRASLAFAGLVAISASLAGCGRAVEVPTAYVGKLSTPDGLQKEIIPPSKIRLTNNCVTCDNLILVQASDLAIKGPA